MPNLGVLIEKALFLSELKRIDSYVAQWAEARFAEGKSVAEIKQELRSLCQKSGREK